MLKVWLCASSAKILMISEIGQTSRKSFYYLLKNSFDKTLLYDFKQLTMFFIQESFEFIIYCGVNGSSFRDMAGRNEVNAN